MRSLRNLVLVLFILLATHPVAAQSSPLINVSTSPDLGKYLVGKDGLTLYSYPLDPLNQSTCEDKCATAWPPLIVDSADKITVADGIPGVFSTVTRKDGKLQVAYNGIPLYYWFKDAKAGDTTGHRVGRVWWVVPPATVYSWAIPKLGTVLLGPKGQTLYTFTKDTAGSPSTCEDKCADAWPPLTVKTADALVPGINLQGKFGTVARKDGSLQVTYNGWPLYTFKDDKAIGDANGEAVGKVWYTVVPETVGVSNSKDNGDFLVTYDGMTLYTFAKDTAGGPSTCSGDCAKAWPPFTVFTNDRLAAGSALKGKLGTITRDDKTIQVTYNGMPLYLWAKDHKPGDATGLSAGPDWKLVAP